MELGNIVKTKYQRHGKIVQIQSSIDGRKFMWWNLLKMLVMDSLKKN